MSFMVDLLGIIGLGMLLSAYIPTLFGKLKPDTYRFMFMNLIGGFSLMLNGFLANIFIVYPLLNLIWTIGTTFQILRKYWKKRITFKKLVSDARELRERMEN